MYLKATTIRYENENFIITELKQKCKKIKVLYVKKIPKSISNIKLNFFLQNRITSQQNCVTLISVYFKLENKVIKNITIFVE